MNKRPIDQAVGWMIHLENVKTVEAWAIRTFLQFSILFGNSYKFKELRYPAKTW